MPFVGGGEKEGYLSVVGVVALSLLRSARFGVADEQKVCRELLGGEGRRRDVIACGACGRNCAQHLLLFPKCSRYRMAALRS